MRRLDGRRDTDVAFAIRLRPASGCWVAATTDGRCAGAAMLGNIGWSRGTNCNGYSIVWPSSRSRTVRIWSPA